MARIRTHPGEVLKEEFMAPLDLSANRLAIELAVPATRIGDIIRSENPRAITADTALRLARYFGVSPQFWMGLQKEYELDVAADAVGERVEREVRVLATARHTSMDQAGS